MIEIKLFFILILTSLCSFSQVLNFEIETIKIDSSSIRAIQVQKDSSVYYASSKGTIGLVSSSGKVLYETQIKYDTLIPHFRTVASNGKDLFLISVANPALLYKYQHKKAVLVYTEKHEKVFYDALAFFNEQYGIAMGDPTEDCLSIILTKDGGNTWQKIPCKNLPKVEDGEFAYAASNGSIAIFGTHTWLVTGGKRARVFYSPDMGKTWNVYKTPIIHGKETTGIYSTDFYDAKHGIIFGGDWANPKNKIGNKAITNDGGKTWQLIADGTGPGYKSCIQYIPNTNGKELIAVGFTGISYSSDGGQTWRKVSDEKFYTIRFVTKNFAWLGGNNKIGKMILSR